MTRARLTRSASSDDGTFGFLECYKPSATPGYPDECLTLQSGELPDKGNIIHVSCIPKGVYTCHYRRSSKNIGGVDHWYEVLDVPGRSGILIHPGNYCGDKLKGKRSDVEGCIILGTLLDTPDDCQHSVRNSRTACAMLLSFFNGKDFQLEIA